MDATWLTGNGGFGYADNDPELVDVQTRLTDMSGGYSTFHIRKEFNVTTAPDPTWHLLLTVDWDDGFIAWLDGNYLTSANSPGAPAEPAYTAHATALHESSHGNSTRQDPTTYDLGAIGSRLSAGNHVLALMALNDNDTSSDCILIGDLSMTAPPPPTQNPISGVISTDTTLYASNSVYTVVGHLTINSGVTLTIEAGTAVHLNGGVNVTVANGGRLLAEGTEEAPIQFIRPSAGASSWGGFTIDGSVGSPETRIMYAYFEGFGATRCIEVAGGTVLLGPPDVWHDESSVRCARRCLVRGEQLRISDGDQRL